MAKTALAFLSVVFLSSTLSLSAFASLPPAPGGYGAVKTFLHQLQARYPKTVSLIQIGQSDSGEVIEGVAIGNGPIHNLVVATHHGNEYGSTEVAKGFASSLAANPIRGQTIYVIPVLNIGGYNKNSRWEPNSTGSHDANRDYPGPCGTEGPFNLKSTKALAEFTERQQVVAAATLHTYYPAVVYPWGISTADVSTPYDGLFQNMVQAATAESRYETGNSTQVIYPADGTYEDYAFWQHGVWSILFELGESHSPDSSSVNEMVRVNVPGLRRMFEQAPTARAEQHAFTGRCNRLLRSLDRHDE